MTGFTFSDGHLHSFSGLTEEEDEQLGETTTEIFRRDCEGEGNG